MSTPTPRALWSGWRSHKPGATRRLGRQALIARHNFSLNPTPAVKSKFVNPWSGSAQNSALSAPWPKIWSEAKASRRRNTPQRARAASPDTRQRRSNARWGQGLLSPSVRKMTRVAAFACAARCNKPPVASTSSSGCGARIRRRSSRERAGNLSMRRRQRIGNCRGTEAFFPGISPE